MALPEPIKITRKILSSIFESKVHETIVEKELGTFSLSPIHSLLETKDNKGTYTLWKFPVKDELQNIWNQYPIYFAFNIKLKPNEDISEVNIKLFKEDTKIVYDTPNNLPTELLLRVEWSNELQSDNEEKTKPKHAQPHWHIHSYTVVDKLEGRNFEDRKIFHELLEVEPINEQSIFNNLNDDNDNVVPVIQTIIKKDIPSFKFHLAMLAEWDRPIPAQHDKLLTNYCLERWLPKCLSYIKEQIEYILEKMGE